MNNFIKKYPLVVLAIICLVIFTIIYYLINPLGVTIKINNQIFHIDVAVTSEQKEKGLGDKESMDELYGMFFPYDHKEQYSFWMKGMKFPLDFVWIDGNIIADITENVPILTNNQITVVKPNKPVDKILELNAGIVRKYNIKIGDTVKIKTL
jgi:uncharacterized protein